MTRRQIGAVATLVIVVSAITALVAYRSGRWRGVPEGRPVGRCRGSSRACLDGLC